MYIILLLLPIILLSISSQFIVMFERLNFWRENFEAGMHIEMSSLSTIFIFPRAFDRLHCQLQRAGDNKTFRKDIYSFPHFTPKPAKTSGTHIRFKPSVNYIENYDYLSLTVNKTFPLFWLL